MVSKDDLLDLQDNLLDQIVRLVQKIRDLKTIEPDVEVQKAFTVAGGAAVDTNPGESVPVVGSPGEYSVRCSDCGALTTVPFKPRPDWKVYCKACYNRRKNK